MAWLVLIVSACFEAVWATALGESERFTRAVPTVVFLVGLVCSMAGLGWAATRIPLGTAYAGWTGLGAALTATYAMATGAEQASLGKLVCIGGIIAAVVGLKLLPAPPRSPGRDAPATRTPPSPR